MSKLGAIEIVMYSTDRHVMLGIVQFFNRLFWLYSFVLTAVGKVR